MTQRHAHLPRLRITEREFRSLPNYSASIPTGVIIGKRWRRLDGIHDKRFIAQGGKPRWMIGEYIEVEDKTKAGIKWWRPIIIVRSQSQSTPC